MEEEEGAVTARPEATSNEDQGRHRIYKPPTPETARTTSESTAQAETEEATFRSGVVGMTFEEFIDDIDFLTSVQAALGIGAPRELIEEMLVSCYLAYRGARSQFHHQVVDFCSRRPRRTTMPSGIVREVAGRGC